MRRHRIDAVMAVAAIPFAVGCLVAVLVDPILRRMVCDWAAWLSAPLFLAAWFGLAAALCLLAAWDDRRRG